jgi:hypothetical protein
LWALPEQAQESAIVMSSTRPVDKISLFPTATQVLVS